MLSWFLLFSQFWPIDIFIVQSCVLSLDNPSSVEGKIKIFENFVFLRS